jgi:hypothetical protein
MCVCVGEIVFLPWFSKELKNDLSKNNCLRGVILILLVCESLFVGWGSPFPIVLVPRYKLSLCHTPIKPDLLGFPRIGVFVWGLHDHVITRFASLTLLICSLGRYYDVTGSLRALFLIEMLSSLAIFGRCYGKN